MTASSAFKVGEWLVEPSLDRVSRGDEVRGLRPQVMELLVYLAERPGEVVSTDQLLEDLWDGRVVTEGSVYNCVSELRVALTSQGVEDPAVETIPKKGYRLVAPVGAVEPQAAAAPRQWLLIAATALVVIGIGVLAFVLPGGRAAGDPITSIAVLPLDNNSSTPAADQYIADGMTDVVVGRLGRIQNLLVISRTTMEQLKARNLTVPEMATELGIDAIIEGSVMTTADAQVRVTLQLIDGRTDGHLWSRDYVRNVDDIIQLQDEVANTAAAEIFARLASPAGQAELEMARRPPTSNADAYRAYLKARYRFSQFGEENFRAALRHYDEAISLDPQFALAYASRAEACSQPAIIMNRIRTLDDCYYDALRATELDDTRPEGFAALGMIQLLRWEWHEGGRTLDRAVELNPNSVMARQWRMMFYRISYRFEEALEEIRYAEERDPLNLFVRTMVGWPLYDMRRFDEALAQIDEVLYAEPDFMLAHYNRGIIYVELRNPEGVFEAADRVAAIAGTQSFEARLLRASGHAIEGDARQAREIIDGVEADGGTFLAAWIAAIYLMLGDENAALTRLERGLAERAVDLVSITEPRFDSVRNHPRFRAVSEGIGLPLTR